MLVMLACALPVFAQQETVISVTGTVIDETTRQVASVNVAFFDKNNKKVGSSRSNSANGYYLVTGLKPGEKYKIQLESPDFFKDEFEIQLPKTTKYAEISRDFTVKPLVKGAKIWLRVSPFELRKSKIRVGGADALADINRMLLLNPGVSVEIQSYPDADGDANDNQRLTQDRANTLKQFLIKAGVADSRIAVKASGVVDPVNPPSLRKAAKGKRYTGPVYLLVTKV
jgi:outer membrane protein OmpA-like peptidoglycan-associated protein